MKRSQTLWPRSSQFRTHLLSRAMAHLRGWNWFLGAKKISTILCGPPKLNSIWQNLIPYYLISLVGYQHFWHWLHGKYTKCMEGQCYKTVVIRWLWLEVFLSTDGTILELHLERWPTCSCWLILPALWILFVFALWSLSLGELNENMFIVQLYKN